MHKGKFTNEHKQISYNFCDFVSYLMCILSFNKFVSVTHDLIFQIYVWHTRSEKPSFKWQNEIDNKTLLATNLGPLSEYWNNYIK